MKNVSTLSLSNARQLLAATAFLLGALAAGPASAFEGDTEPAPAAGQRVVTRAEVVFARYRQGGPAAIERRLLFPLDLARLQPREARLPPLHNLPPEALLEKLVAEYVFALLTEAAVESLASENAARFAAMEAAHDNVTKKLDQLRQDGRQARQSEITTELIELVTGAEAQQAAPVRP